MGLEGVTIASVQVVDVLERAVDGQHSLFIREYRFYFSQNLFHYSILVKNWV